MKVILAECCAVVCLCSLAFAEDFKTTNGKEYKNAKVSRVEPDGIVISFSGGIVKIPFTEVSVELQQKYNYDPEAAKQFAADVQQQQADLYEQTKQIKRDQKERAAKELEGARKRATPAPGWESGDSLLSPKHRTILDATRYQSKNVDLKYDPPEGLAAAAHKAARAKMFSPEEENEELAKIPLGGALEVTLYGITIDAANPKWLTYIIGNSAGEVLERKQGHSFVPSYQSEFRWWAIDIVKLPAFDDSLRVRIYHELLGNLGDYVVPRNGQPQRIE
jgi:hypothetical protein